MQLHNRETKLIMRNHWRMQMAGIYCYQHGEAHGSCMDDRAEPDNGYLLAAGGRGFYLCG